MAYGTPIDSEIVDFLPGMDSMDQIIEGFIDNESGNWKPCRVSFTRWYPSIGEWKEFGGFSSFGAGYTHYFDCVHRVGFPRSFQHEELNFNDSVPETQDKEGLQLMHDHVLSKSSPRQLNQIMHDHQSGHLENFHLVCRRDGGLFLDFIIEDSRYEPVDIPYANWLGLDLFREHEAKHAPQLQPCPGCVTDGGVSMRVDMHNVHGRYGFGRKLLSGKDSLVNDMASHQWIIFNVGARRLAIPHSVIQGISGHWFRQLPCFPPA